MSTSATTRPKVSTSDRIRVIGDRSAQAKMKELLLTGRKSSYSINEVGYSVNQQADSTGNTLTPYRLNNSSRLADETGSKANTGSAMTPLPPTRIVSSVGRMKSKYSLDAGSGGHFRGSQRLLIHATKRQNFVIPRQQKPANNIDMSATVAD